jgi:CRP/FNR family transcriptional regulator
LAAVEPVHALLSSFLLQDLSPGELEPLLQHVQTVDLAPGDYLFHAGDEADEAWVLASGQARLGIPSEGGDELVIEVLVPPDLVGLIGVFSKSRVRQAEVVATEACRLYRVPAGPLRTLMQSHPAVMWRAMERLSEIVRSYSDSLIALAYEDLTLRVARRLVDLCDIHGEQVDSGIRIPLKVSQTTLAGMVGATREGVNRTLGTLVRKGILRTDSGAITVTDMKGLRKSAGDGGAGETRSLSRAG